MTLPGSPHGSIKGKPRMQDLIKKLLDDKGTDWIQSLTSKVGFTKEQAADFVPDAVKNALGLVKDGKIDMDSIVKGDVSSALSGFDAKGLAEKVGIDESKAVSGLTELLPNLFSTIKEKFGGLDGLAGLLGDSGGMVGKLAG